MQEPCQRAAVPLPTSISAVSEIPVGCGGSLQGRVHLSSGHRTQQPTPEPHGPTMAALHGPQNGRATPRGVFKPPGRAPVGCMSTQAVLVCWFVRWLLCPHTYKQRKRTPEKTHHNGNSRPLACCYWPLAASPTTDHNGESAKSTLLPSRRVLNGPDVAGWALVAPRAENGTVSKISN